MNTPIKLAVATSAAIVVAVVGFAVLRPSSVPSVGSATPPTASPLPSSSSSTPSNRMVVEGSSVVWTADLPARWSNQGWFVTPRQGPKGPTGIAVGAPGGINVPSDPCDGGGKVSDNKTPADVVEALGSREDLVVSNAIETTLGGYSGLRVDVEGPADLGACEDLYVILVDPGGLGYRVQGPSNRMRMWIVDVEDRPRVFQIESFPGTPPDDLAAAQRIVDSIEINP
jgi:hypothetical protein